MAFLSKPQLCALVLFLQFLTLVVGYKVDSKSCTGKYGTRVKDAMDEVEAVLAYAEQRSLARAPFKRDGTLLQDLLDASKEDDANVLRTAGGWFNKARHTIARKDIIIHCDDKHLTKAAGRNDLYYDNSDNRQGRVQVLNVAGRKATACGGVMRAFAYDFFDKTTGKTAGEAIILCSDSGGALTAADPDTDLEFWRSKDLRTKEKGLDFFDRFLSYMLLHELMHVTDHKQFPVNPGGKAELYGYKEITGNAVGSTGARGPSSLIRLHNADSYAYLACAWYMNGYHFEAGKFVLTPKADRPPASLAELTKKVEGGKKRELETRVPSARLGGLELEARELSGFKWPSVPGTKTTDLDHTELEAHDLSGEFDHTTEVKTRAPHEDVNQLESRASKKKATKAKPKKKTPTKMKTTKAKTPTKATSNPASRKSTTSACPAPRATSKPKKGVRGLLERAAKKVKGKNTKTGSPACTTSLPPLVTAIGDPAREFSKIDLSKGVVKPIPDSDDKARKRLVAVITPISPRTAAVPVAPRATSGFVTSVMPVV